MALRDALSGFWRGLTGGTVAPDNRPPINVVPGAGNLEVVDTTKLPTKANVPGSWNRYWLGPGEPFSSADENARSKDRETEPRAFQYITNINSTISPRLAYGLTAFTDLRYYAETVPEVSMCLRLLTEEMKAFVPTLKTVSDKTVVTGSEYDWMTQRPDRYNPFPVWLSRFLYNVLVYDAGCAFLMRNSRGKVTGSRVIDGSTIFVIIDERGESPRPPAPAYQQIIWGVPKMMLNTRQIWYKPRHLRADAPYGRSPIEDSLPAVKLLESLWDYEFQKYQVGNIPEMVFTAPESWKDSADAILEFEEAFNARMAGSNQERVRARFLPAGVSALQTKELTFNKESYDSATNAVRMAFGILQSEVGEGPNEGLGGKGYAEAMSSAFYRMGLAPLIGYVESHFNDILEINNVSEIRFSLEFPPESLDPTKEEEKYATRFQIGGIKRDEYRQGIGMKPLGGEEGEFIASPGGGSEGGDEGEDPMAALMGGGGKKPGMLNVGNSHNVQVRRPIRVAKNPIKVGSLVPVNKIEGKLQETPKPTDDQYLELGDKLGVDWNVIPYEQFKMGVEEEMEHADTVGGDLETIARIALDHLNEDDQYYNKLKGIFAKYEPTFLAKYCGVDPEDDMLFGSPVVQEIDASMPTPGANESQIVSIGGGAELDARPAVWKPASGEKEKLRRWVGGELYRRAEAAYLLDRELAPDEKHYLVPVTYTTEVDGEIGSVQHYVIGRQPREEVSVYDPEFVERAAVLDFIMGQVDRNRKNWLTHPHNPKRPVLIDSDLSFPHSPSVKLHSSFVDAMIDRPLSQKTLDAVYLLVGNHELWEDLAECLEDEDAVRAARARAQQILDEKRIAMLAPVAVSDSEDESVSDSGSEESTEANVRESDSMEKPVLVKAEESDDLAKAEWEESKHPRSKNGEFAPKGQGSAGGGAMQAPPASNQAKPRVGTATYERAKEVVRQRHVQDAKDKEAKAREMSRQNHKVIANAYLHDRVALGDFRDNQLKLGDHAGREMMNAGIKAASELMDYEIDRVNGDKPKIGASELPGKARLVRDAKAYINASETERARIIQFHGIRPNTPPAPPPPPQPVKQKILIKNPVRYHAHYDTPEKVSALKEVRDAVNAMTAGQAQNATHIEFYGTICQSGTDFDRVRALIHVAGPLNQSQQDINRAGGLIVGTFKNDIFFVSDTDEKDRRGVEKIRRDNRDQRLGNTSIHQLLHLQGTNGFVTFKIPQPETAGGTHGTEALKLKANPGAHIWNKLRELKGGAQPPKPAKPPKITKPPVVSSADEISPDKRTYSSTAKRTVLKFFAAGQFETKNGNQAHGINSSFIVTIKGDGKGIMKPLDRHNHGNYGTPQTDVLASELNDALGFDVVPTTGYRDDPDEGRSSVQEWHENCDRGMNIHRNAVTDEKTRRSLSQMAVLDMMGGNVDRHGGNWLYSRDTHKLVAIDNGFSMIAGVAEGTDTSMHAESYLRDVAQTIGEPLRIYQEDYDKAKDFANSPACDEVLRRTFNQKQFISVLHDRHFMNAGKWNVLSDADAVDEWVRQCKRQIADGLTRAKKYVS